MIASYEIVLGEDPFEEDWVVRLEKAMEGARKRSAPRRITLAKVASKDAVGIARTKLVG